MSNHQLASLSALTDAIEDSAAEYVVFDTESNGLFTFKKPDGTPMPADAPGQPRLASFAAIVTDAAGIEIARGVTFVRPEGWSMLDQGEEATRVNGLTDEFLIENGRPVSEVLEFWNVAVDRGRVFAAFNAQHDCKHVRAELRRAGQSDRFEETRNSCLMRSMKNYKDQGVVMRGGRFISLVDACEFFGIPFEESHEAMNDAEAALAIMHRQIADGCLIPPAVHYAKVAPAR